MYFQVFCLFSILFNIAENKQDHNHPNPTTGAFVTETAYHTGVVYNTRTYIMHSQGIRIKWIAIIFS